MNDKDEMVKYGVDESELVMEKTAGREEDKITSTIPERIISVGTTDFRATPPWHPRRRVKPNDN